MAENGYALSTNEQKADQLLSFTQRRTKELYAKQ